MRFDSFLVNSMFTLICSVIVWIFARQNYKVQKGLRQIIRFIIVFGFFNAILATYLSGINFIVDNIMKPATILIFSIIVIWKLLSISIPKSIISFCTMGVGLVIGSSIAPLILSLFRINVNPETIKSDIPIYLLANLISTFISIIFIVSIYPIRNIFAMVRNNKAISIIIGYTFIMIVLICSFQAIYKGFEWKPYTITFVLMILTLAPAIWFSRRSDKQERIKNEFEQQKFYNTQLESLLSDMRRFKHDWSNTLIVLQSMLKNSNIDNASEYLSEITHNNKTVFNTALYNIKNAGLFGIISPKLGLAAEKGIDFSLNVIGEIRDIPNIKISELCEVTGIFLDNAIEAAEKSSEKDISMIIKNTGYGIEMQITNSCYEKPIMSRIFDDGYSTKGANRGQGLHIVKNILNKHKNILLDLSYDQNENQFIQCMVIA